MKPLVIKLGGVLLDTPQAMENLFTALANYQQNFDRPLLIVHGGGCVVDELMQRLALPVQKKNGLRVTPADQIDIIVGALAGIANKTLVAQAAKFNLNPVGLCLADGKLTTAQVFDEELGHVANVTPNNPKLLHTLLSEAFLPIISSIAVDDQGNLMNVNADQAATAVATLIGGELVMLSDVDGVLDANKQRLPQLDSKQIQQLIQQGVITDGMIVKVNAALDAAKMLNTGVDIANWKYPEKLTALFAGEIIGTRILP
ncbi:acetylglutamate kinase [Avibacterium sp. 21-586]|uniref:acetylglutamate kinase n=1 Tax=Avibacterium sp. 21-586 TaxID=2911534 RepID=UPI002247B966|nr:acetylglutamate kinase [Avibacterium sp. 21-586]MCW9709385.1 acetylglutamate kinase [Avibacterium sp. 21-586]